MIDLFQLFAQPCGVLDGHILNYYQRERTLAEILHKLILSYDGVHIIRQIVKHIVVYAGTHHTEYRRYHKEKSEDQDRNAVFNYRF